VPRSDPTVAAALSRRRSQVASPWLSRAYGENGTYPEEDLMANNKPSYQRIAQSERVFQAGSVCAVDQSGKARATGMPRKS
jgi:hypothetical protein